MVSSSEELDLHRHTVDEAIPKIDDFLYNAFQAGLYQVWIVHGKGTGILKQAVSRYLAHHTLVKSYGPADRYHGGNGSTRVDLSEQ